MASVASSRPHHSYPAPKRKLAVDVEHGFEPSYEIIPERKDVIAKLRQAAKQSRNVYLASDPDREGADVWPVAAADSV